MKIPLEIITYILDFVDIRSVLRFTLVAHSDVLDRYLQDRLKFTLSECMREINSIKYDYINNLISSRNFKGRKVVYKNHERNRIRITDKFNSSYKFMSIDNCKINTRGMHYSRGICEFQNRCYDSYESYDLDYIAYCNAIRIYAGTPTCEFYSSVFTSDLAYKY